MKKVFFKSLLYAGVLTAVLLQSCSKENLYEEEIVNPENQEKIEIVKEFDIQPEWFKENTLKGGTPSGDIYNNFGQGVMAWTGDSKNYVFLASKSLKPLVRTTLEELTIMKYISSTSYSEIDQNVNTEMGAALGVSAGIIKAGASITVNTQSKISSSSSSVYVSVLYLMKYGTGVLRFTDPSINNYLIYNTNLHSGENTADGINISVDQFRNTYGDGFKSQITFGCLLNATIQITNVNFSSTTSEQIKASAEAAVGNMVEGNATWASSKTISTAFKNSNIIIDGVSIPTGSFIYDIASLKASITATEANYNKTPVANLGVLVNKYDKYSNLYPYHAFYNTSYTLTIPLYGGSYSIYMDWFSGSF